MKITFQDKEDASIIIFNGEFSVFFQEEIENNIFSKINEGKRNIVFDLSKVNYLDSSGISIIVTTAQKIKQKVRLIGCQPNVKYVLDLAEIDAVIDYCETMEEAVNSFKN